MPTTGGPMCKNSRFTANLRFLFDGDFKSFKDAFNLCGDFLGDIIFFGLLLTGKSLGS